MAKTLTEAASSGNKRDTLLALRDCIARQIQDCESGRDMASLSKRLMEIMDELDKLPDPKSGGTTLDKMRKKYGNG